MTVIDFKSKPHGLGSQPRRHETIIISTPAEEGRSWVEVEITEVLAAYGSGGDPSGYSNTVEEGIVIESTGDNITASDEVILRSHDGSGQLIVSPDTITVFGPQIEMQASLIGFFGSSPAARPAFATPTPTAQEVADALVALGLAVYAP